MSLTDRLGELRRGIVYIQEAPTAPVLEEHIVRVRTTGERIGSILEDVSSGQIRPGILTELEEAFGAKLDAQVKRLKVDRSIVVFNALRIPLPQRKL